MLELSIAVDRIQMKLIFQQLHINPDIQRVQLQSIVRIYFWKIPVDDSKCLNYR